jgi:Type I phosphodiesterase / nucleotide pyrophosphatase
VTAPSAPERIRRKLITLLSLVAVAFAGTALIGLPRRAPADRVIVLGFDGASPNLMQPLIDAGKLPALKRLQQRGVYGRLASFRPTKSGVLWTSVATGKTMLKHGVVDWTHVDEAGLDVPFKPSGRTAKTYWEILGERGLPTVTLNWWFSYPARPVKHGVVVSDVFSHGPKPGSVYPPELLRTLAPLRVEYPQGVPAEMRRHGISEWSLAEPHVPMGRRKAILESYGVYFAHDVTVERASDYLFERQPARVFSTYFRLVDITSHFAYHFLDRALYDRATALDQDGKLGPEDEARIDRAYAELLEPAYRFMDRIVAKYVRRMDERTTLIVLSDHGFEFDRGHYRHAQEQGEPPDGVIFLAGRGVRQGQRLEGATLFDVAPTVLYLEGQPVAADMDGGVLWGAIGGRFAGTHPARRIASYEGVTGPEEGQPESADAREEVLQDLRTLGYIGSGEDATP